MLEKKYESYTYSDLLQEYKTLEEKTATLKKDLIVEMAKRKELEGIEKKKIASVLYEDLKDYISQSHIKNVLAGSGFTDSNKASGKTKKEITEELKPILVGNDGAQELEEPDLPNPDNEDLASNLIHNEIIDQTHLNQQEPEQEEDQTDKELAKIELIRDLKVENNNLTQQLSGLERLQKENDELRATITELEKENTRLFNRNKELEEENNKLKQENRALRNPPKVEQQIPSMFSSKSHDDYLKNRTKNMVKGKK